ncbi:MAG: putative DNA binding domain-containing protein [Planctomycetes bacterium]|jgi:ATP-dependent DNA helicase RecG|nr:putative DNA binding domain-containing protein [Planctomycetota bacterium]
MKESQTIEWKETWRDEYLRWICGFANADGGVLVIGRDDDGNPTGLKDSKKLLEDLPNKIRDVLGIIADVRLVTRQKKDLIEIHVEPYPSPISYKGEYHYRTGSTKQELKGQALERFLLHKRGRRWDDVPEPSFTVRKCSAAAMRRFRQSAAGSHRMDRAVLRDTPTRILASLELVDRHGLKRAACLLFAERPENFVSGAWIKIGFFASDSDLRYQDEVHGDLLHQVEATMELLHTKYLKAAISYDGLQRRETFPYPEAALREALLNAVVHKDYGSGIPIQISVYDDHLVIWNPGVLPERWTLQHLLGKHPSQPFNPLLANAFFRAGYVESWGRGIERIQDECKQHGIGKPIYDTGMSGLMVTFRATALYAASVRGAGDPGSTPTGTTTIPTTITTTIANANANGHAREPAAQSTRERIMAALRSTPNLNAPDLAHLLGISVDGIRYHIRRLTASGRLRRHGTKGGHWEVLP